MAGRSSWRRLGPAAAGAAGIAGSIVCSASMTLAAAGVTGAAVSAAGAGGSTAGMAQSRSGDSGSLAGVVSFLVQAGPALFTVSILTLLLSLALRRLAAIPFALLAGGILFWGTYGQTRLPVMLVAGAVGIAVMAAAFAWAYGTSGR